MQKKEILDIVVVAKNDLKSGAETVRKQTQELIAKILRDSEEADRRATEENEFSSFAIDD